MRAISILKQSLFPLLQTIHSVRLESVFWAVQSLLLGGRLSLTCLGRSAVGKIAQKHSIKRVDRLLGNSKIHKEFPLFYRALAHTILRTSTRPVILIDWTRIEPRHVALVASVPLDGRSLPIYIEVHSEKKDSNPTVMKKFLHALQKILPENTVPIIVTDAGFRSGWFQTVQTMNWDFVGRMRNTHHMQRVGHEKWELLKSLYRFARSKPRDLGNWTITRSNPIEARIIAYRKRKHAAKPEPNIGSAKLKSRRKMKDPWLLATSLADHSAKQITKIYGKRMQIEETFRDAKNHRFGWSFRHARTDDKNRFAVLLLVASIAMFGATLVGNAAERKKWHYRYQANTIRTRRVLSLFFLGMAVIKDEMERTLTREDFKDSYADLKEMPEVCHEF